jgi:hypothetical protein
MDKQNKTGANRLDASSTDALHWAECLYEQIIIADRQFKPDDFVGWFANYWAAVNDPLQNTIYLLSRENHRLRTEIEVLKEKLRVATKEPAG